MLTLNCESETIRELAVFGLAEKEASVHPQGLRGPGLTLFQAHLGSRCFQVGDVHLLENRHVRIVPVEVRPGCPADEVG